jgi:hypothetical protein
MLLMVHDTLSMGPLPRPTPNRSLRLAAYRSFVYWVWGKLEEKTAGQSQPVLSSLLGKPTQSLQESMKAFMKQTGEDPLSVSSKFMHFKFSKLKNLQTRCIRISFFFLSSP